MKKEVSIPFSIITCLSMLFYAANTIVSVKQMTMFGMTTAAGVLFFPFMYIISDIVSEVYGYKQSRIVSLLSLAAGLLMIGIFWIAIRIPAASGWALQGAFESILGQSGPILLFGVLATLIGDWVNDKVFVKIKEKLPKTYFVRSIASSIVGQIVDSIIFFAPVAYLVWGIPLIALPGFIVGASILGFSIKIITEVIVFPLNFFIKNKLKKYEGA